MAIIIDNYRVTVPGDAADTIEQLAQLAIDEARERAHLRCTPAEWSANLLTGKLGDFEMIFLVKRRRNHA